MIVRKTGIIVYNSNKQVIRQSDNSKDFFKKSLSLKCSRKHQNMYSNTEKRTYACDGVASIFL